MAIIHFLVLQQLSAARQQWFDISGEHAQKLLGLSHSVLSLEASRSAPLSVQESNPILELSEPSSIQYHRDSFY